jgi:hypothetical protein
VGKVGQQVSFTASASGDPTPLVQWEVSTDGGADFTDVPEATAPTYTLVVTSADNGDQYRAVFMGDDWVVTSPATLTVVDGLAVATTSLPSVTGGVAFSAQLQAVGGGRRVTWRKTKGLLPKGVALESNGTLSGTPAPRSSTEDFSFTVRVRTMSHGKRMRAVRRSEVPVSTRYWSPRCRSRAGACFHRTERGCKRSGNCCR